MFDGDREFRRFTSLFLNCRQFELGNIRQLMFKTFEVVDIALPAKQWVPLVAI